MKYALKHCTAVVNGDSITYTGPCVISGKIVSVTVPAAGVAKWRSGAYVQEAFPGLSADDREFLLSGISGDEYDRLFPDE